MQRVVHRAQVQLVSHNDTGSDNTDGFENDRKVFVARQSAFASSLQPTTPASIQRVQPVCEAPQMSRERFAGVAAMRDPDQRPGARDQRI